MLKSLYRWGTNFQLWINLVFGPDVCCQVHCTKKNWKAAKFEIIISWSRAIWLFLRTESHWGPSSLIPVLRGHGLLWINDRFSTLLMKVNVILFFQLFFWSPERFSFGMKVLKAVCLGKGERNKREHTPLNLLTFYWDSIWTFSLKILIDVCSLF